MFQSTHRKSLSEEQFEDWIEKGRENAIGYHYLLIVWNELDQEYQVEYLLERNHIFDYNTGTSETIVAAYDLYSGSRILIND